MVIMNLELSKISGPNCIPVVVLKNCKPELLYKLVFNICCRSLVFLIVGRSHWWSLYLTMLGKGLQLKTRVLLEVSKIFEKLVKNRSF